MANRTTTTDDDLIDQWEFLDTMVERQAARLRAGIQDEEEPAADAPAAGPAPAAAPTKQPDDVEAIRRTLEERVAALEKNATELQAALAQQQTATAVATRKLAERDAALAALRAEAAAAQPAPAPSVPPAAITERDATIAALRTQLQSVTAQLQQATLEATRLQTELSATQQRPQRRWWQR